MPKPGGILFIGSSSIRKWVDLPKHFSDKPIIMRGVGGSQIWQWVQYFSPSVVYPYQPSKIFIYVGDNDVAAGHSAQEVYDNFLKLMSMFREHIPGAKVYFMSLKLSPSRAKYYNEVALCNKMISDYIKKQSDIVYLDMNPSIANAQALPDSALFLKDMLHLNKDGYDKWEQVIAKYL